MTLHSTDNHKYTAHNSRWTRWCGRTMYSPKLTTISSPVKLYQCSTVTLDSYSLRGWPEASSDPTGLRRRCFDLYFEVLGHEPLGKQQPSGDASIPSNWTTWTASQKSLWRSQNPRKEKLFFWWPHPELCWWLFVIPKGHPLCDQAPCYFRSLAPRYESHVGNRADPQAIRGWLHIPRPTTTGLTDNHSPGDSI